ncbi:hypothetical protein CTA1_10508 [Colletotrichum tanaceti]|uniref:Uncharacterized protein n=1 Tax=Colletotrichum tanaceti TaxID=1306861 RepID=A0A4U6X4G3_9PEZI|nr:hypothetical protein CTA1_10508 [Colletotrichum tanaceti]
MGTVKDLPREAADIATRSPSAVHFLPPGTGRLPAASGPEAAAEAGKGVGDASGRVDTPRDAPWDVPVKTTLVTESRSACLPLLVDRTPGRERSVRYR